MAHFIKDQTQIICYFSKIFPWLTVDVQIRVYIREPWLIGSQLQLRRWKCEINWKHCQGGTKLTWRWGQDIDIEIKTTVFSHVPHRSFTKILYNRDNTQSKNKTTSVCTPLAQTTVQRKTKQKEIMQEQQGFGKSAY